MSNPSQATNMNCFQKLETLNEKLKELARVMTEMSQGLRQIQTK